MNAILQELDKVKVIDKEDILNIKKYINLKYSQETLKKSSMMLSSTINKIIYNKMEFVPENEKISIKNNVIKNTFGSGKTVITLKDIFESIMKEDKIKNNFLEELITWININTRSEYSIKVIEQYLKETGCIIKEGIKDRDELDYKKDELLNNEEIKENIIKNDNANEMITNADNSSHNKIQCNIENNEISKITSTNIESNKISKITSAKIENKDNNVIQKEQNYSQDKKIKAQWVLSLCLEKFKKGKSIGCVAIIILGIFLYNVGKVYCLNSHKNQIKHSNSKIKSNQKEYVSIKYPNKHMPKDMRYKEVNKQRLKQFLNKRNSILAEEPYFSTLFSVSKEFNINPIVLFAITGQEQSFVPKNTKNAKKIANNPFNVYHSWMEYNTDINDAAKIASRTVINLSKNRPENEEAFAWIGRKYAEDKNWGKGVRLIFKELNEYITGCNKK